MSKFTVYVPEIHIQPYVVEGVETAEEAKDLVANAAGPEGVSVRYDKDDTFFERTMESNEHYYEVLNEETEEKKLFDDTGQFSLE